MADPYFEPIGPGAFPPLPDNDNDGDGRPGRGARRFWAAGLGAAGRAAMADVLGTVRTRRFWSIAVAGLCATWAVVAALVLLPGTAGDSTEWVPAPILAYVMASSLLPASAALVAMHWGMRCYGPPAAGGDPERRIFSAVLAAALRGLVFAVLILVTLLLQAAAAGEPGTVAAISAGVAVVEGTLFGGMGVAVAALGWRAARTRVAGWALALFLVAGTVAAAAFLVPAVRTEEPVTVALNIERAPDGSAVAYECSAVSVGVAEVYRTERVMWLPAASPGVLFVMLAGDIGAEGGLLGSLSAAFQEAADGTQVLCVNGEPRTRDAQRMPMAAVGLLLQAAVAGALLAGASGADRRRRSA
jgi:hypothetical protein